MTWLSRPLWGYESRTPAAPPRKNRCLPTFLLGAVGLLVLSGCSGSPSSATGEPHVGGEATLQLPDLSAVSFAGGVSGPVLLGIGMIICLFGLGFGVATYAQLNRMPVHRSMREISELIYSTCKAYLLQQGKFLMLLWLFIAAVIVAYYKFLVDFTWGRPAARTSRPPGRGWSWSR